MLDAAALFEFQQKGTPETRTQERVILWVPGPRKHMGKSKMKKGSEESIQRVDNFIGFHCRHLRFSPTGDSLRWLCRMCFRLALQRMKLING